MIDIFVRILFFYLIVLNFFLAFFILFRNPKKRINQSFALLCIVLSVWIFALFASQNLSTNPQIWLKLAFFTQLIIIINSWYISFIYPKRMQLLQGAALIFGTAYFIIFSILLFFSSFWLSRLGTYGNAFLLYSTISWIPITWTILNFRHKLAKSVGLEKIQLKYVLMAYVFWAVNANFLANIFSISGNDLAFFAFSGLASLVFTVAIFYAIARYRLLDIRFLVSKAVVYGLLLLVVTLLYTYILFVLGLYFYQFQLDFTNLLVTLSLTLLVAITVFPLKKGLEKLTNRALLKGKILTNEALKEFSALFVQSYSLENLAQKFCLRLRQTLNLENANLLVLNDDKFFSFPQKDTNNFDYKELTRLLKDKDNELIFDDIKEGKLKDFMRKRNIYFLQSFKKRTITAVFILGYKLNGDIYYDDERNFLNLLLSQFFIALERVLIYEDLKNFNQTLSRKVKLATSNLRSNNKSLRKALELKDELISVVSHELVVPMAAISGSISTVLEGYTGRIPAKSSKFLQAVYNENIRLLRMTKNLLNISKIKAGNVRYFIESFNPSAAMEEVVEFLHGVATERGVKINLITSKEKTRVKADRDKLKSVLINLIDNAIHHSEAKQIELSFQKQGNLILFTVKDEGVGIPVSEQKNIFIDLDLLNNKKKLIKKGRGLGLYISQKLLSGMNGKIRLESKPGKGSTFSFTLPSAQKL